MQFAKRSEGINSSFIRDILNLTKNKDIISFAGGLPNPGLFPTDEFASAAENILKDPKLSKEALQYGQSAGYRPLIEIIAKSYKTKDNLDIDPDLILITNGSQQGLDLISKIFINEKDRVLLEGPTYLAALQSMQFYRPEFYSVQLEKDGPKKESLNSAPKDSRLFYCIPNFQNPSGISWSNEKRKLVADFAVSQDILLVEDDPYGEIRFEGGRPLPLKTFYEKTVMLGSFSKILAPGLRLGWIIAPNKEFFEKLLLAKQAADLHTSQFTQMIAAKFYENFNSQAHIEKISQVYKKQKDALVSALREHLPDFHFNDIQGGMFIWGSFPEDVDTLSLLDFAVKEGVAYVPGIAFFAKDFQKHNFARLNFSNSQKEDIVLGVKRLRKAYEKYKEQR